MLVYCVGVKWVPPEGYGGIVSPNTRMQRRKVMLGLFNWLTRTGQLSSNPVHDRKLHTRGKEASHANLELIAGYRKDCAQCSGGRSNPGLALPSRKARDTRYLALRAPQP